MQPGMLQMMYPMLMMSAITTAPQVGFGIYDRIEAKRKEEEQKQQLAQWYAMQNQRQGGAK